MKIIDRVPRSEKNISITALRDQEFVGEAIGYIKEEDPGVAVLFFIKTEVDRQGIATLLLLEFLNWAKGYGVEVVYGDLNPGEGVERRRNWCKKRGFTLHHDQYTVYGDINDLISKNSR